MTWEQKRKIGRKKQPSKLDWFCQPLYVNVNKSFISQKKITKFSAQNFLQGKNQNRTRVGHIKELLGLLSFRRLGSFWDARFHVVAFSLSNS